MKMTISHRISQAIFCALLFSVMQTPVWAQKCNSKLESTSPSQRFTNNGDGTISDKQTGLQWSVCSLGQTWDETGCHGEAQALPYAIVSLVTADGWRLPEVAELSSLVELRCADPAINRDIFPDTEASPYWTATRFVNKDGEFWQVHFLHGEAMPEKANGAGFVRWVKNERR